MQLTVQDCVFLWECGIRVNDPVSEEVVGIINCNETPMEILRELWPEFVRRDPDLVLHDEPDEAYLAARINQLTYIGDVELLLEWVQIMTGSQESASACLRDVPYIMFHVDKDVNFPEDLDWKWIEKLLYRRHKELLSSLTPQPRETPRCWRNIT
jgi:hypothetical protein